MEHMNKALQNRCETQDCEMSGIVSYISKYWSNKVVHNSGALYQSISFNFLQKRMISDTYFYILWALSFLYSTTRGILVYWNKGKSPLWHSELERWNRRMVIFSRWHHVPSKHVYSIIAGNLPKIHTCPWGHHEINMKVKHTAPLTLSSLNLLAGLNFSVPVVWKNKVGNLQTASSKWWCKNLWLPHVSRTPAQEIRA